MNATPCSGCGGADFTVLVHYGPRERYCRRCLARERAVKDAPVKMKPAKPARRKA